MKTVRTVSLFCVHSIMADMMLIVSSTSSIEDSSLATSVLSEDRFHLEDAGFEKKVRFDNVLLNSEQAGPHHGPSYPQLETGDAGGNMMHWAFNEPLEMEVIQSTYLGAGTSCRDPNMCSCSDVGNVTKPINDSHQAEGPIGDPLPVQRHPDTRSPIIPTSPHLDVSILSIDFQELTIPDVRPAEYFILSRQEGSAFLKT